MRASAQSGHSPCALSPTATLRPNDPGRSDTCRYGYQPGVGSPGRTPMPLQSDAGCRSRWASGGELRPPLTSFRTTWDDGSQAGPGWTPSGTRGTTVESVSGAAVPGRWGEWTVPSTLLGSLLSPAPQDRGHTRPETLSSSSVLRGQPLSTIGRGRHPAGPSLETAQARPKCDGRPPACRSPPPAHLGAPGSHTSPPCTRAGSPGLCAL